MAAGKKKTGSARGLGKGLDSLIPEFDLDMDLESEEKTGDETDRSQPVMVDIHLIEPNREQPRKSFDEEEMEELADSIKQYGILQPLLVQKKEDYYAIVAGERRWRAALLAGMKEVPVILVDFDDRQRMEVSLIENIQRQDLNPVEESKAYRTLIQEYGMTHEEVAERVSKSRTAITNSLRLLKLDDSVLEMLENGELSQGHARALLAIDSHEKQNEAARKIVEKGLSVREAEKLVKDINAPAKKKDKKELPGKAEYQEAENRLKDKLGTMVSIRRRNEEQGKIEISYYSVDELERLLGILVKSDREDV